MAIQKVEDKNKLLSKVELHPKRTYISGSWGVSGSIYVFPNRSETQKDNIDERLNLFPIAVSGSAGDGIPEEEIIRPFSGDSLEARRIEIYSGNFNMFDNTLVDSVAWEYRFIDNTNTVTTLYNNGETIPFDGGWSGNNPPNVFLASALNDWVAVDQSRLGVGDFVYQYHPSDNTTIVRTLTWTSNYNWTTGDEIYNRLPDTDRDFGALNYEVPLALLLDGADPNTRDHAYRAQAVYEYNQSTPNYSLGNSSLTGGTPEYFQFTGWNYEMQNGFPVETSTITSRQEVNAWPPEIDKWSSNIITTFIEKGYSDLSMHPRNKTQKFIDFQRADYDYFSDGSIKQRLLFRSTENLGLLGEGWNAPNSHCLSLSSWTDKGGTERVPALVYPNRDEQYEIDYSVAGVGMNLEFWIKPSSDQTSIGTICQLRDNYAVLLIPDDDFVVNGIPTKFKISFRSGQAASDGEANIATETDFREGGGTPHVYISNPLLDVNEWHHIAFRWGRNFNNGQFSVYINAVKVDEFDGIWNGTSRTGLIDIGFTTATTENYGLFVGGYPSTTGDEQREIWESFSVRQKGISWTGTGSNTIDTNTGLLQNFSVMYQLKSELTELRCYTYPRTELQITQSWTKRMTSTSDLLFYIPFLFDSNHQNYETKPFLVPGELEENYEYDPAANMEEIFYTTAAQSLGDQSNAVTDVQRTPFCANWGFIAGIPFVHVGSHTKEYTYSEIPVVLAFPCFNDVNKEVYYNFDYPSEYTQVSDQKIKYLIDRWRDLPWLTCWNNLIFPCTLSLENNAAKIIDTTTASSHKYEDGVGGTISYHNFDNVDFEDDAAKMFEDDKWRQGDREEQLDTLTLENGITIETDISSWTQEPSINNNQIHDIDEIIAHGGLFDQDVLTPYSPVISIPIIYYGNRIQHGSFVLSTELASGKELKIVDQNGMLYIADKDLEPTPAKVGHIDYHFGYMCIFSHLLANVTNTETTLEFRGEKNLHVMQFDLRCPPGLANESKNSNFQSLRPTANANETDSVVTYISTIYLHDDNLNVIGKVKLAQPIQKREEDSFLFRVKLDF